MAGGSPDSQGEEGIPGHRPRGGDVKGSGGNSKSPFHSLHHLPRLSPWVPGRSRNRHHHPRGQSVSAASGLREEVLYVIFLDLYRAYNALDRSRRLEILEGYGVWPQARKLLQTYWHCLTMVERAGGYYGTAFRGERGVTQSDPLSPIIFNVVVDAVVRHWVKGVVEESEAR